MADRARYDSNLIPSLIAVSNADGVTPVSVWADPSTHGLISSATLGGTVVPASGLTSAAAVQIVDGSGNQITSFGGGTQYTDGGTPPTHPVAPTLEFNNAGAWVTVGSANPLPVTGAGGGTVTQGTAAALTAGWPTINGEAADVTGTFTNATQTTSVTATNLDGYGNTLISINGTYGTATAVFEGSDDGGSTWYTVQAARDNTNVIETGYTALTNTSQTWQINNPGLDSLRVRSTAVASGTVNVRLSSSAAPVASGTIIGIGTSIPAGTNVIGKVGIDQTTPGTTNLVALAANQSVNVAQINGVTTSVGVGASGTGTQRVVVANDAGKTLLSAGGSASSSGNNTIVAAGTNKLKVYAFTLSTVSATAVTCIFQSGASGTELWRVVLQAPTSVSTGANLVVQPPAWLFATGTATLLNLNLSSANAVHWSVSYWDES